MAAPYGPGGPREWSPRTAWGPQGSPPPNTREADLTGLTKIWTAALVSIIGSALGFAVPLALSSAGYFNFAYPSSGSTLTYSAVDLYAVLGLGAVGLATLVVSFGFYRGGFLAIRPVDPRFSSSPTWALLVIVGLALVVLAVLAILIIFLDAITCAGAAARIPSSCVSLAGLFGVLGLLIVGLILLLIGYIGTLVGIWRLGSRYGESLFKIGAVLLIFPYLSVVGQILVLVAASSARTKIRQKADYAFAPSVSAFPPSRPPGY